jgi:two-component system nitrogen regulation response regulator NtrX
MSKNGSLIASEILIVDDEEDIRDLIAGILHDEGYATRVAGDSEAALTAIRARRPQLVVLDIWLQGSRLDGIEVLDTVKREHPELPVVMISGHGTIETAVASIKKGAYDFIEKPFKADRLLHVVERALEAARLKREVQELKLKSGDEGELVGNSPTIAQLRMLIDKIAPTNSRVLIAGPAGSGKEVAARLIHGRSRRASNAFVAVNCATMEPDRLEAELFGIESGEAPRKIGLFELAHNGTLYLDEVADMPLETQGKILRVLIEQTFTRVGGQTRVQVDARVICSTTRDLRAETEGGRFREDLYHRLNVVPVRVPSLAERRDDIPVLVSHFMKRLSAAAGLPMRNIGQCAPIAQYRRKAAHPGGRRCHRGGHRRSDPGRSRQRQWLGGRQKRRSGDLAAAARGAGDFRARLSDGPDQPLRRQHLAHRRLYRHGALGLASQAQIARSRVRRDAEFQRLNG